MKVFTFIIFLVVALMATSDDDDDDDGWADRCQLPSWRNRKRCRDLVTEKPPAPVTESEGDGETTQSVEFKNSTNEEFEDKTELPPYVFSPRVINLPLSLLACFCIFYIFYFKYGRVLYLGEFYCQGGKRRVCNSTF